MSGDAGAPLVRSFAALSSGIHAIPREQATEEIRAAVVRGDRPRHDSPLVWLDISNPGEAEARYLRETLGFHPLAVEDCVRGRQRPKIDRYPGYFFLVAYAASINPDRDRMALNEVHLFLGARYLVTVHDHRVDEVAEIVARWRATPQYFQDVGSLAHALLDSIVDDYFPVLEHYAEQAEPLEDQAFLRNSERVVPEIFRIRHELVLFRRVVVPLRDVLSTLLRRDLPGLQPELLPYFQDVHDHTIRVAEEIDMVRELLTATLEAQRSEASNRLNHTVRQLTAWSIILMSVTLIAGIYGMNFQHMPELGWRWGYPGALGLMLGVGVALAALFRRKRWM